MSSDKDNIVKNTFDSISDKYELISSIISFGMVQKWRKDMLNEVKPHGNILDCGAGTGTLTETIIKYSPDCNVISLDINSNMINNRRNKNIKFVTGNAEEMPFDNNTFDYVVSSYLTRNLSNINKFFLESFRVLKPNGIFATIDAFNPENRAFNNLYSLYFYHFIPFIGDIMTSSDAYTYLANSVKNFYSPDEISDKIQKSGFKMYKLKKYIFGIVSLHIAKKLE